MGRFTEILNYLQQGNSEMVSNLTRKAIEEGIPPKEVLDRALIEGMNIVGKKYGNHEIFLPEVLLAARAMYAGMDVLKPLFLKGEMPQRGRVVIGTVQGDLHDIGKNLVGIMLRGAGFEVIDLGNDVPPEMFIEAAKRERAMVIGMSALLTTTMPVMGKVVELLRQEGLQDRIKTIIGGAPVSKGFAQGIGADAYSHDSANAVKSVKELVDEVKDKYEGNP